MVDDEEADKASHDRATELAKDATVEGISSLVPGVGALVNWAWKVRKDRGKKRVEDFFRQLLTGEGPLTEDECKESLEKEPLCSEVLMRLLEDDEDEKAWAYAALFRSFADDLLPKHDRLRFLRCARELTNAELKGLRAWQKTSKPYVKGPSVTFRVTFGPQYREWFIQPELMQEEAPHIIEVLCRWGFISRVHERAKQAKLPGPAGVPDTATDEFPVPGRFRLQVEPTLALLLLVFANRGHGRDLDLRLPKELSVHEDGRVDAINFTSDRKLVLDGTAPDGLPFITNSTETLPGTTPVVHKVEQRTVDASHAAPRARRP